MVFSLMLEFFKTLLRKWNVVHWIRGIKMYWILVEW